MRFVTRNLNLMNNSRDYAKFARITRKHEITIVIFNPI